jgi:metal-responsive CopG/Arc/MetJ family transcriptional regulator
MGVNPVLDVAQRELPGGPMRESISISLPEDLKNDLDRFARSEGITRSDLIREAVREYLFSRRARSLRRELMPYAEAQGIFTDEDVFRELSSD